MRHRIYFVRAPSDELYHFGIKGMRWGIRKDKYAKNYTKSERQIDKSLYGGGGVRRINKRMHRGISMNDARAIESRRLARAKRNANRAAAIGATIGGLGGTLAGMYYADKFNDVIKDKTGLGKWITGGAPGENASFSRQLGYAAGVVTKNRLYEGFIGRHPRRIISTGMGYAGAKLGSRVGKGIYGLYSGYGNKRLR